MSISETTRGLDGDLTFRSDLFDLATGTRLVAHFLTLLDAAVRNPGSPVSRLPLLSDEDRQLVVHEWNRTSRPYPDRTVHALGIRADAPADADRLAARYREACGALQQAPLVNAAERDSLGRLLESGVTAHTATLAHQRIEVEDVAMATLRFASGALGVIEATTTAYPGALKRIEIHGSEGSAVLEEEDIKTWAFAKPTARDKAAAGRPFLFQ